MKQIKLATLDDSGVGVGTMRISAAHAAAGSDSAESIHALQRGLDLGLRSAKPPRSAGVRFA